MNLPIGSIILWYTGVIPTAWRLCDGNNGTPDLRGYFVKGATNAADLLASGGVSSHSHTVPNTGAVGTHTHTVSDSTGGASGTCASPADADGAHASTNSHTHTLSGNTSAGGAHSHTIGDTDSVANLPPHIKLYYIMKVQ